MKNKKIFWTTAIIIGIALGLYLSQDLINEILLPDYYLEDVEFNDLAQLHRFYIIVDKDVDKKGLERLGKQAVIALKKKGSEISSVMVFLYKSEEDFKKSKLYARINFERDEKYLIKEKTGKYKDLYYSIDIE